MMNNRLMYGPMIPKISDEVDNLLKSMYEHFGHVILVYWCESSPEPGKSHLSTKNGQNSYKYSRNRLSRLAI